MLHSTCKFCALFSESPVPACRASRLKSMILWWTCSCICDPSLLFHADSCLMTSCSLYILQKPRSLHPWSPADPASCPTTKTWKGKGKNTNAKKTRKGEPDRNELVDPCASYKISERLHELQRCLFATCRCGRTYISKNQLVPACPVPGSFSRIELRAFGPQRSDQNHHFCDIPENIWPLLDPANAVTEITIQGVYSMGIHLSCSLAQVRQNAMIQLPRGFVSGCTRTGPSMAQGHPDLSSYVAAEAKEWCFRSLDLPQWSTFRLNLSSKKKFLDAWVAIQKQDIYIKPKCTSSVSSCKAYILEVTSGVLGQALKGTVHFPCLGLWFTSESSE